jgi:hypothetical protein
MLAANAARCTTCRTTCRAAEGQRRGILPHVMKGVEAPPCGGLERPPCEPAGEWGPARWWQLLLSGSAASGGWPASSTWPIVGFEVAVVLLLLLVVLC